MHRKLFQNMKYELILFDLDGTLVDSASGVIKSIDYTIDFLSLPQLSEEEKSSCWTSYF